MLTFFGIILLSMSFFRPVQCMDEAASGESPSQTIRLHYKGGHTPIPRVLIAFEGDASSLASINVVNLTFDYLMHMIANKEVIRLKLDGDTATVLNEPMPIYERNLPERLTQRAELRTDDSSYWKYMSCIGLIVACFSWFALHQTYLGN